jgi:molybdenum transport protein
MVHVPDADIDRLIAEDADFGDLTAAALGIGSEAGVMRFKARHGCLCNRGGRPAAGAPRRAGGTWRPQWAVGGTGNAVADGLWSRSQPAYRLEDRADTGGVGIRHHATAVRAIVDTARAQRPDIVVACTREAVPLTRGLSIKAVHAGGGTMHRNGLSDTVLLFAEHRAFIANLDETAIVARLHAVAPERKLAVEVSTPDTALAYAQAGADVLQLEKLPPESVSQVVAALAALSCRPLIVVAGGVNATNAAAYAAAGADVLAASAPYAAPPRDVQVTLSRSASS